MSDEPPTQQPDELAKVLEVLQQVTTRDRRRVDRSETHWTALLIMHATAALVTAPLFLASQDHFTSVTWDALSQIPGFPLSMALLLLVGGLVLLSAALIHHRAFEIVGLSCVCLWHTVMGVGFVMPCMHWLWHAVCCWWTGDAVTESAPMFYMWATYTHLALIMVLHMHTLVGQYLDTRRNLAGGRKLNGSAVI